MHLLWHSFLSKEQVASIQFVAHKQSSVQPSIKPLCAFRSFERGFDVIATGVRVVNCSCTPGNAHVEASNAGTARIKLILSLFIFYGF